jgi:hypothetical protein
MPMGEDNGGGDGSTSPSSGDNGYSPSLKDNNMRVTSEAEGMSGYEPKRPRKTEPPFDVVLFYNQLKYNAHLNYSPNVERAQESDNQPYFPLNRQRATGQTDPDYFFEEIIFGGYAVKGIGVIKRNPVREVTYSDDLVKAAEELYPKKVGKFEFHHPFPKYMGGEEKQSLIKLPAPYHQQITNEFFKYWPKKLKGQPKVYPTAQQAHEIMQKVYSKFPLPCN